MQNLMRQCVWYMFHNGVKQGVYQLQNSCNPKTNLSKDFPSTTFGIPVHSKESSESKD